AGTKIGRVPFAPSFHWSITADGALCYGSSDEYAIHIERPSSMPLTLRRSVDPVHIPRGEREWHKLEVTLSLRANRDDWEWDGPRVPNTKPFFEAIFPGESGRIWVLREGPGVEIKDCNRKPTTYRELSDRPCWKKTWFLDVFEEASGRFLGTVPAPDGFRTFPIPYIRDDLFICGVEDNSGAPLVKVFRIRQSGL
ncbi:MAG: hypothetical protein KAV87_04730, partial [Desulfobacteraceae bacterium]|nr:hypothetical protein [Desulfobacteraceae bacterium]